MSQPSAIGTRIRERRVLAGIRQIDLAERAGISASYLNLIEHNRRRIAGKTLHLLAGALEVEPAWLSDGVDATLVDGLSEAAGQAGAELETLEPAEDFAGRFPNWAHVLQDMARRVTALEETVQSLTDRLAHDPHLEASLHEVITTVTAIRSTASILVDTKEIQPEWRTRFNRNIHEDSTRLAEGAEALARYLADAPDAASELRSPQDELDAFLAAHDFCFPALETGDEAEIAALLSAAGMLVSDAGRDLTRRVLEQCVADAALLPRAALEGAIEAHGMHPDRLLRQLQVPVATLFRRLALSPKDTVGPVGLVMCDGSGALTFRKPISGFMISSAAGACPLWPLYQALAQPRVPLSLPLVQAGRIPERLHAYAVAEQTNPIDFGTAPQTQACMLLLPASQTSGDIPREVGSTCRICPRAGCSARRERSIIRKGF